MKLEADVVRVIQVDVLPVLVFCLATSTDNRRLYSGLMRVMNHEVGCQVLSVISILNYNLYCFNDSQT